MNSINFSELGISKILNATTVIGNRRMRFCGASGEEIFQFNNCDFKSYILDITKRDVIPGIALILIAFFTTIIIPFVLCCKCCRGYKRPFTRRLIMSILYVIAYITGLVFILIGAISIFLIFKNLVHNINSALDIPVEILQNILVGKDLENSNEIAFEVVEFTYLLFSQIMNSFKFSPSFITFLPLLAKILFGFGIACLVPLSCLFPGFICSLMNILRRCFSFLAVSVVAFTILIWIVLSIGLVTYRGIDDICYELKLVGVFIETNLLCDGEYNPINILYDNVEESKIETCNAQHSDCEKYDFVLENIDRIRSCGFFSEIYFFLYDKTCESMIFGTRMMIIGLAICGIALGTSMAVYIHIFKGSKKKKSDTNIELQPMDSRVDYVIDIPTNNPYTVNVNNMDEFNKQTQVMNNEYIDNTNTGIPNYYTTPLNDNYYASNIIDHNNDEETDVINENNEKNDYSDGKSDQLDMVHNHSIDQTNDLDYKLSNKYDHIVSPEESDVNDEQVNVDQTLMNIYDQEANDDVIHDYNEDIQSSMENENYYMETYGEINNEVQQCNDTYEMNINSQVDSNEDPFNEQKQEKYEMIFGPIYSEGDEEQNYIHESIFESVFDSFEDLPSELSSYDNEPFYENVLYPDKISPS